MKGDAGAPEGCRQRPAGWWAHRLAAHPARCGGDPWRWGPGRHGITQADHDWLEKIKTQSENAAQGAAVMKAKGFLRKDIVEELSRFELARLTQPHLPDTQSPDSARAVEEAVFTDADRTDAERLRAFAGRS